MKHFIALQKRKGLYVPTAEVSASNESLVHQFNHELMKYGYFLSRDLFDRLSTLSETEIQSVYNDVLTGIARVTGGGGHIAIYDNFPQSVLAMSYKDFWLNAVLHYWTMGTWKPEDAGALQREFAIEAVKYKELSLLTVNEFESIFTDILYSGASISAFDKEIVDWFIDNGYKFDFSKITFKETAAYVGKRLMDSESVTSLPTKDAVNVLRIWAAYSGGDEGLKTNTKFKNPKARQRKVILSTLEKANNLEEAFKTYREKWLRLLLYVNPMTATNKAAYPNVANYTNLLRNEPAQLRTFNSRVEELLGKKDASVLDLLKTRGGVFMRRLDHTVRIFGVLAIEKWLETNPKLLQLITAYNHFTDRGEKQDGRGAVLASQGSSNVVTYDSHEALDKKLVDGIKATLLERINACENENLTGKKVFIERALYYRPMATNNRAASLSLDGKVNGTVEVAPAGKTIRMYVHWYGGDDIDLSGLMLTTDNGYSKVGWDSGHRSGEAVVYSGDNTGYADKNAEYLDINIDKLATNTEWIISMANVYRGKSFSGYPDNKKIRAGWMVRSKPEANSHWLPETLEHSQVLNSDSKTAYLMALHVPTRSLVYLDLSMGNAAVSTVEDAIKMRTYLRGFVTLDDGAEEVSWAKFNQGHIIHALSKNVVATKEEADIVFDENATWESVAKYL